MSFANLLGSIGKDPTNLSKIPSAPIRTNGGPAPTQKGTKPEPNKSLEKLSINDNALKVNNADNNASWAKPGTFSKADPRKDALASKPGTNSKADPRKDTAPTKPTERTSKADPNKPVAKTPKSDRDKSAERPNPLKRKASSDAPPLTAKPPPKPGSYAALMAAAKEKQKTVSTTPALGTIKHAAAPKDRLTKWERRRRREEEARVHTEHAKGNKSTKIAPTANGSPVKKAISARPLPPSSGYKGTAKPPEKDKEKQKAPPPSYRGTAGLGSKKPPPSSTRPAKHRPPREDRYLDTDEEEEDGFVDDDEGDVGGRRYSYADEDDEEGYSDASSDMEAGAFDVETEERVALRAAKEDDEREDRLEKQLKKEKEERRRRLEMMAKNAKGRKY